MKKLAVLLTLLLLPTGALAAAIVFDTTPGGAGGSLFYAGAGGSLFGIDIGFVEIQGVDTPLNNNAVLTCVDCLLDFQTGANTLEGPPLYTWLGGGSFTLTGDIPALGLDDVVLLSGSFTATPNTPGLATDGVSALFIALGIDEKDQTLADFYGLGGLPFLFANTEIALDTFTELRDGGFIATPNQADIVNAPVPEPATLILIGTGLVGASALRRRWQRHP